MVFWGKKQPDRESTCMWISPFLLDCLSDSHFNYNKALIYLKKPSVFFPLRAVVTDNNNTSVIPYTVIVNNQHVECLSNFSSGLKTCQIPQNSTKDMTLVSSGAAVVRLAAPNDWLSVGSGTRRLPRPEPTIELAVTMTAVHRELNSQKL